MKRIYILLFIFATLNAVAGGVNPFEGEKVLWLGTSIPGGCTYPAKACEALGMTCINKALGASFLCKTEIVPPFMEHSGYSLTQTSEEKMQALQNYIAEGLVDANLLRGWVNASWDVRIADCLGDADIVIIDHGYNDGDILASEVEQDYSNIDWTSTDRTTYIGAFGYLYRLIKEKNPEARIITGGYFQNKCSISYTKRGQYVAKVSEWIADHYQIPLLDVWHYTDIPDGYMPNSKDYLSSLNKKYGTDFKPIFTDKEGNITYFQKFCPDGVHPFSDPTGESDKELDTIFTNLLRNILTTTYIEDIPSDTVSAPVYYNINGVRVNKDYKGILIEKTPYSTRKLLRK